MSTLFQRVIGDLAEEGEGKIAIHGVRAMFGEVSRGAKTPTDIITAYTLDEGQQADLVTLMNKMNAATDKVAFSRFIFDWLVLAELGRSEYRDEVAFWARVDVEAV